MQVAFVPPIQLGDLGDAAVVKPFLEPERDEKVRIWMRSGYLGDGRVGEMVVVGMTDDDGVDDGYVFDLAGLGRVALWGC